MLISIKMAMYYENGEEDIVVTVMTDSMSFTRRQVNAREYGEISEMTPPRTSPLLNGQAPTPCWI